MEGGKVPGGSGQWAQGRPMGRAGPGRMPDDGLQLSRQFCRKEELYARARKGSGWDVEGPQSPPGRRLG